MFFVMNDDNLLLLPFGVRIVGTNVVKLSLFCNFCLGVSQRASSKVSGVGKGSGVIFNTSHHWVYGKETCFSQLPHSKALYSATLHHHDFTPPPSPPRFSPSTITTTSSSSSFFSHKPSQLDTVSLPSVNIWEH